MRRNSSFDVGTPRFLAKSGHGKFDSSDDFNMKDASSPAVVTNCAVAPDGGSLWLELSMDGQAQGYSLQRSLASRGTPRYDEISGEDGRLTKDQLQNLQSTLEDVLTHGMCAGIVQEFLKVLRISTCLVS